MFNMLLSDLPTSEGVTTSVYADDVTMYVTADTMEEATEKLQAAVDTFFNWTTKWGLTLNPTKSAVSYFTQKLSVTIPIITINNVPLKYDKKHKLLGIIFDSPRLTWKTHLEELRTKCQSRLNIMKFMSGTKHGCSRSILLTFYRSYIRSLTDYSLPLYSSASKTLLTKIDVVHSTAARLITGAWRNTPLLSLYCETGLLPPDIYRDVKSTHSIIQLLYRNQSHPVHTIYSRDSFLRTIPFSGNHNKAPLLYRVSHCLNFHSLSLPPCSPQSSHSPLPPWYPIKSIINTSFTEFNVREIEGAASITFNQLIQETYPASIRVFTDGSASPPPQRAVGVGVVVPQQQHTARWKLHPDHSIVAAELFGILQALLYIKSLNSHHSYVICTDSLSSLQMISSSKLSSYIHLIVAIHSNILLLPQGTVHFLWIPAHCGIAGNEEADKVAKEAVSSLTNITVLPLAAAEFKSKITGTMWDYWQRKWNSVRGQHHLGSIKCSVKPWRASVRQSRYFEVLSAQMRLGLPPLNYALHRINRSDSPHCSYCQSNETVHHFLLSCPHYSEQRRRMCQQLSDHYAASPTLALLLSPEHKQGQHQPVKALQEFVSASRRFDQ